MNDIQGCGKSVQESKLPFCTGAKEGLATAETGLISAINVESKNLIIFIKSFSMLNLYFLILAQSMTPPSTMAPSTTRTAAKKTTIKTTKATKKNKRVHNAIFWLLKLFTYKKFCIFSPKEARQETRFGPTKQKIENFGLIYLNSFSQELQMRIIWSEMSKMSFQHEKPRELGKTTVQGHVWNLSTTKGQGL